MLGAYDARTRGRDEREGQTPLQESERRGNDALARMLLDAGADADAAIMDTVCARRVRQRSLPLRRAADVLNESGRVMEMLSIGRLRSLASATGPHPRLGGGRGRRGLDPALVQMVLELSNNKGSLGTLGRPPGTHAEPRRHAPTKFRCRHKSQRKLLLTRRPHAAPSHRARTHTTAPAAPGPISRSSPSAQDTLGRVSGTPYACRARLHACRAVAPSPL
jgi:hypothetical protein